MVRARREEEAAAQAWRRADDGSVSRGKAKTAQDEGIGRGEIGVGSPSVKYVAQQYGIPEVELLLMQACEFRGHAKGPAYLRAHACVCAQ